MTLEAAHKNFCTLKKYDLDLGRALKANSSSPLGYGSEFRKVETLDRVFGRHPNLQRMRDILLNGSDWPMEELNEEKRVADVKEALAFGNHKGASAKPELLQKLVSKDIKYGYALVVPLSKFERIPGALMAPMNIMNQNTIDECGRIIGKDRLTHDQSYKWGSGTSVNSRVEKSELLPCMFGP